MRQLWLLALVACFACQSSFGGQNNYPFSIDTEKSGDGHHIVAHNLGPAPISLRLSLTETQNISHDRSFPLYTVVPPGNRAFILSHIRPATTSSGYKFKTQAQWIIGNVNARHAADTVYQLPFRSGASYRISQAPGGPVSTHNTPESEYAVDIPMPEGTPILAARAGTVIETRSLETIGKQSPDMLTKANVVRILHSDGTIALYAHLAHSSIQVSPGQQVTSGQQIAQAGSTGYSSGPHLHFAVQSVQRNGDKFATISLPFNFYLGNPAVVFSPQTGMLINADHTAPGRIPPIVPLNTARPVLR
jgi:murein DD-endopeptidase MepM/ murein hydrolase activator NlpD